MTDDEVAVLTRNAGSATAGMKLQRNPLCEYCLNEGRLTAAVAVDHIVPIT